MTRSSAARGGRKNVEIPSGVIQIGYGAFWLIEDIGNVTLPESLISIGESAFIGCNLNSITIPAGVTAIHDGAFLNCSVTKIRGAAGSAAQAFARAHNIVFEVLP